MPGKTTITNWLESFEIIDTNGITRLQTLIYRTNPFKADIHRACMLVFTFILTENTRRLYYKDQSLNAL
jgi:hypothetical protein